MWRFKFYEPAPTKEGKKKKKEKNKSGRQSVVLKDKMESRDDDGPSTRVVYQLPHSLSSLWKTIKVVWQLEREQKQCYSSIFGLHLRHGGNVVKSRRYIFFLAYFSFVLLSSRSFTLDFTSGREKAERVASYSAHPNERKKRTLFLLLFVDFPCPSRPLSNQELAEYNNRKDLLLFLVGGLRSIKPLHVDLVQRPFCFPLLFSSALF